MTEREADSGSTLFVRACLVLAATGIVSASSVRHAIVEGAADISFAVGYALYLGLMLLATSARPVRHAAVIAFSLVAATYLSAASPAGNVLGLVLYVIAATLAFVATPRPLRGLAAAAFALWTPALLFFGPEPIAGGFPPAVAVASLIALLNVALAILDRSAVPPGERVRRVAIGILVVATVAAVVERHLVVASLAIAPDDVMALVVVAVLPLVAVVRLRPRTKDAIATGLALATYVLIGVALIAGKGYHVDAVVAPHRAAQILLQGQNPYPDFDQVDAAARFGLPPELLTNYEDGSYVRDLNYPALAFLVVTPFVAAGGTDIRWVYLAEMVVVALVLLRAARVSWPLVAAAVVGNTVATRQFVLAGVDPTWALLLLVGWVSLRRRWLSPIAVGLACAARQPAWFVVPFYLIAVWRRDGGAEAIRRAAVAAAAAIVPNVPFFVTAPAAFLNGVFGPLFAPFEPYGVGLVRFGMEGAMPLLPRAAYGALAAAAFALLAVLVWRRWRALANGAAVFPLAALWFAWRSLQNYFAFLPLFALAGDERVLGGGAESDAGTG